MQMPDIDDLALWYALNRPMINYWADVDDNGGRQAHEFYLPDALYAVGANQITSPIAYYPISSLLGMEQACRRS
jgi:hypothetical protein